MPPEHGQPDIAPRRAGSLRRRLLGLAAAVLAPVVIGAIVCGLVLLHSATRGERLAEELADESGVTVALFQGLQAARLSGSGYMEEGESDDLVDFRRAQREVDGGLATTAFDAFEEQAQLDVVRRHWREAVAQLDGAPSEVGSAYDDESDPEDEFEEHVNHAIAEVERLVDHADGEIHEDLAAMRRLNRTQPIIALVALLTALGIAALLARRLAGAMLRPINRLTRAARAFGSGHLDHRVAVSSSLELQEMAETFNRMAGALQEQHHQLERQG